MFSLETSREQLAARLLALAPPTENERTYAKTIYIDDNPALSVADIYARCRQLAAETSWILKIMEKELAVPVVCLSQLSRVTEERESKRPILSDLRESGSFVSEVDIVLFLYRDSYYNEDLKKRNIVECIVAKNLRGETGTVELRWMPGVVLGWDKRPPTFPAARRLAEGAGNNAAYRPASRGRTAARNRLQIRE